MMLRDRFVAVIFGLFLILAAALPARAQAPDGDPALVLHYRVTDDPGDLLKDLSGQGNHGKTFKTQYLDEVNGQKGVLRFDGESSYVDCGDAESLQIAGDMTLELRVRINGPIKSYWAYIFGDDPIRTFYFTVAYWHTLMLWYHTGEGAMLLPVERTILGDSWSHIAVVVEYPRCRFYHNGDLVRDAYMPLPGVVKQKARKRIGGQGENYCPIDLHEIRLYRRALTPAEIAAHAQGKESPRAADAELAVEPDWYAETVALRLSCKGAEYDGVTAELKLLRGDYTEILPVQRAVLSEAFPGAGRYAATVTFPLAGLEGQSLDGVATLRRPDGSLARTVYRHAALKKPDWVRSPEGCVVDVLPPWTPVETAVQPDGVVAVNVWGRTQRFGRTPFPQDIRSGNADLLAAPIRLSGRADGAPLSWDDLRTRLTDSRRASATVEQTVEDARRALRILVTTEYDGYMLFDCTFQARQAMSLESLLLEIPLRSRYATLCIGDRVLPKDPKIPIAEWYSGAVKGDQKWRFSSNIWLGDEERGLCWQAESDEDWHYADPQQAIEILPRGETTTFRANLVNVPTRLAAGETLRYRFALIATPVKPLLRDAWDLRVARSEPYGGDLDLPFRTRNGQPALQHQAEAGVRRLFINVNDIWPYPMPVHRKFSDALHRLINEAHAANLQVHPYLLHERFPVMAPEFDLYGLNMAVRPLAQYLPGANAPGSERPGPVTMHYGAGSQGTIFMCAKSRALQDACIHSLAQRLDEFGDDGVYLDGTGAPKPCMNLAHGCGYRAKDGTIHPTYPIFADREFLRRIYTVVKTRRPNGIVDVHYSFGQHTAGLAYADMLWTGEQWHHLRLTGAKHVASEMTLDKFRAEFMGRQVGVAAETLAYRLGPQMKVAATSLLHDIPNRPSTPPLDRPGQAPAGRSEEETYFDVMVKLWKLRDAFGARDSETLFYWNNAEYVHVSPEQCYATLFKHPTHGVLAVVSNLSTAAQRVTVAFHLDTLGLADHRLAAINALTGDPVEMTRAGEVVLDLASEGWTYVWLRPQ